MELHVFQGELLIVGRVVPYQTPHLKTVSVILIIKQMLIVLTQNHACLWDTRGIKQSYTVGVISKFKSQEICRNSKGVSKVLSSTKHHSIWVQMKEYLNIQYLLFKYLVFFLFYVSFYLSDTSKSKTSTLYSFLLLLLLLLLFWGAGTGAKCET